MQKPRKKATMPPRTLRFALRYKADDWAYVQEAAARERMSINTWLVRVTLAAARRELAKANA